MSPSTDGQALGLTGFGASGHLVLKMVRHRFPNSKVYVFSCNAAEREFALGLGAAYYANLRFEGAPALTRVDRAIDFIWEATPVSAVFSGL